MHIKSFLTIIFLLLFSRSFSINKIEAGVGLLFPFNSEQDVYALKVSIGYSTSIINEYININGYFDVYLPLKGSYALLPNIGLKLIYYDYISRLGVGAGISGSTLVIISSIEPNISFYFSDNYLCYGIHIHDDYLGPPYILGSFVNLGANISLSK